MLSAFHFFILRVNYLSCPDEDTARSMLPPEEPVMINELPGSILDDCGELPIPSSCGELPRVCCLTTATALLCAAGMLTAGIALRGRVVLDRPGTVGSRGDELGAPVVFARRFCGIR